LTSLLFDPSFEKITLHVLMILLVKPISKKKENTFIRHYFNTPMENFTTITNVFCNKNNYNEREAVELAYNIIHNEFILSLNYLQFIPNINRNR